MLIIIMSFCRYGMWSKLQYMISLFFVLASFPFILGIFCQINELHDSLVILSVVIFQCTTLSTKTADRIFGAIILSTHTNVKKLYIVFSTNKNLQVCYINSCINKLSVHYLKTKCLRLKLHTINLLPLNSGNDVTMKLLE